MTFTSMRVFNQITFYGYMYGEDPLVYWSMRFYPEAWRIPMRSNLLEL